MKILLAYSSKTGNTKKVCDAVYNEIKDNHDVDYLTVKETKSYEDYDLVLVGYWVDKGTANREARKLITAVRGKELGLIGTLGADPESFHGKKVIKNVAELVDESNTYHGSFLCRGKVAEKLIKRLKFAPVPKHIREQMYEASINSREPNEEDLQNARDYINKIVKK